MREYVTTIILVMTLPIGEVHSYFVNNTTVQNWIIAKEVPMLLHWNIKNVASQLSVIAYFVAWVLWRDNKVNKTTVKAFLWLAVMDTILYFYNYKTNGFGSVYFWFAGFWLLSYYWVSITHWLWPKIKLK